MSEALDVELAGGTIVELDQVNRSQIARRVIQKHVFGARVAGIDPAVSRAGVPFVHSGVELNAGVRA